MSYRMLSMYLHMYILYVAGRRRYAKSQSRKEIAKEYIVIQDSRKFLRV